MDLLLLFLSMAASAMITVGSRLYRALSEEAIRYVANYIDPYLNLVLFAVTLAMWILFIKSLIEELGASRLF